MLCVCVSKISSWSFPILPTHSGSLASCRLVHLYWRSSRSKISYLVLSCSYIYLLYFSFSSLALFALKIPFFCLYSLITLLFLITFVTALRSRPAFSLLSSSAPTSAWAFTQDMERKTVWAALECYISIIIMLFRGLVKPSYCLNYRGN